MNKLYEAFLFDLDGTICDSDEVIIKSYRELYNKYLPNKEVSDSYLITFSGPPLIDTMKKEFPMYDPSFMEKEYQRVTVKYYEKYIKTFPHVKETLLELKRRGIKIGLVTNKVRNATLLTMKLCDLEGLFDTMVCQDDTVKNKPDPEPMDKALKDLGICDKSSVIYVGDNDIDYVSASNSGLDCMLFKGAPRVLKLEDKFDFVINDISEVLNYAKK